MKLKQKRLLKGTREFEILGDSIYVEIKSLIKKEKLTIRLTQINPNPAIKGSELVFYGNNNYGELFSLFINNPATDEFEAFVTNLRHSILAQTAPSADMQDASQYETTRDAPGWNVYDEPPDFAGSRLHEKQQFQPVNAERVKEDVAMLKTYLDQQNIALLLNHLDALIAAPHDEDTFNKVVEAYNELGFYQGAVLTYAPYLKVLLSKYIGFQ